MPTAPCAERISRVEPGDQCLHERKEASDLLGQRRPGLWDVFVFLVCGACWEFLLGGDGLVIVFVGSWFCGLGWGFAYRVSLEAGPVAWSFLPSACTSCACTTGD